ncbi:hypothetical protein SK128_027609 [Halocaridina rubra]|uniref:Resolvase/invertase-type recombinase catalytic domain-containing protein n=1 Tax=Halocaridina rubra TaxID=373956 RepID=A0AAN8X1M4_HALRR
MELKGFYIRKSREDRQKSVGAQIANCYQETQRSHYVRSFSASRYAKNGKKIMNDVLLFVWPPACK